MPVQLIYCEKQKAYLTNSPIKIPTNTDLYTKKDLDIYIEQHLASFKLKALELDRVYNEAVEAGRRLNMTDSILYGQPIHKVIKSVLDKYYEIFKQQEFTISRAQAMSKVPKPKQSSNV